MAEIGPPTKVPSEKRSVEGTFWSEPKNRALIFQGIALAAIILFGYSIFDNTLHNIESRGITSGFDFLSTESGFTIIQSLLTYNDQSTYGDAFIVSLLNTVLIASIGIVLTTFLGFFIGIARLSSNWLVSKLAMIYIEIFRNIPLLLQIFFWYHAVLKAQSGPRQIFEKDQEIFFGLSNRGIHLPRPIAEASFDFVLYGILGGIALSYAVIQWAKKRQITTGQQFPVLPSVLGLVIGLPVLIFLILGMPMSFAPAQMGRFSLSGGVTIIPEFIALLLALVIYTAAFIAENVRSGIQAINLGQTEAAQALGLKSSIILRLVILPQALRVIIPPLTSQYLNLAKNSSLAAAIAYPDLVSVFAGTALNQTGQALEIMAMTLAVYLSISLLTSVFMNWYNNKIKLVER